MDKWSMVNNIFNPFTNHCKLNVNAQAAGHTYVTLNNYIDKFTHIYITLDKYMDAFIDLWWCESVDPLNAQY